MKTISTSGMAFILKLCFFVFIANSLHAQNPPTETPPPTTEEHSRACVIHFKNGNKFTGDYINWDKNFIELSSDSLVGNFLFSTKLIKSIELINSRPHDTKSKHQAMVQLRSRSKADKLSELPTNELVFGEITAINENSLTLKTAYSSKLVIDRNAVEKIGIEDLGNVLLSSPYDLDQWKSHVDLKPWTTNGNLLLSHKKGHISKDVKLTNRTHIQFQMLSTTKRLNLWFYASPYSNKKPSSYYGISINHHSFSMHKVEEGQLKRLKRINKNILKRKRSPSNLVLYDIYTDLNKGIISVYTDGALASTYIDTELNRDVMGSNIHLITQRNPQTIRGLTIKNWSGILPNEDKKDKVTMLGKGENIYLRNGDIVRGTILGIANGLLKLRTQYDVFKIPLHKIVSIAPKSRSDAPLAKQPKDIILYTKSHDIIVAQFISLNGTQLKIQHPVLGKKTFDMRAFSSVRFIR